MKAIRYYLLAIVLGGLFVGCRSTSDLVSESKEYLDSVILIQNYRFVPTMALPTQYKNVNLDHSFYLKITPTEINSYLPYFGRAYTASMNHLEGGIQFVSKEFEYRIEEKKDKEYEIFIETKDTQRRTKFIISTSNSGYTSVRVSENDRQPISFYGRIGGNKEE